MPLNPRSAAIWAHALETEHDGQTQSALERTTRQRCCLGVACRAAICDGVRVEVAEESGFIRFDGKVGTLPTAVAEWLGCRVDPDPTLDGIPATARNDTYGHTFAEIAAAIRRDLARSTC